ncbi:MAG: hypothetical protein RMK30_03145 [Anaerolineae bacterium]|nr:hypothetical protein [Anaerolineae bacterium]
MKTRRRNHEGWQACPFVEIVQKEGKWYVKLSFKKVVELREELPKGIDIGYRKLIATSDGKHIKEFVEKEIDKKRQGSKNFRQKKHDLKRVVDGAFSNGDVFRCLQCGYAEDVDIIGARNILKRFIEKPIVPLYL